MLTSRLIGRTHPNRESFHSLRYVADGPDRELFTRTFVTDGNFSADHLRQRRPDDDVWLLNGEGMITNRNRYNEHLKVAKEQYTVSHGAAHRLYP